MPRPQRELDPNGGALVVFAGELRALREQAGAPKFATMERRVGRSKSTLAEAAGGRHLPRWDTVADFVRACGADPAPWRPRWEQVRRELGVTGDALGPDLRPDPEVVVDVEPVPKAPVESGTRPVGGRAVVGAAEGVPLVERPVGQVDPARPMGEGMPSTAGQGQGQGQEGVQSEAADSDDGPHALEIDAVSGVPSSRRYSAGSSRSWRSPVRIVVAAAVAGILLVAGFVVGRVTGPEVAGPDVRAVEVQNKVALGADMLVEDRTPVYLSAIPISYCAAPGRSCKVAGTEMGSGVAVVANCVTRGQEMHNYNLDEAAAASNPDRSTSDLWYRASFPDGRAGFISEVYLTASSRGGLGLPDCGPTVPRDVARDVATVRGTG